MVENGVFMVGNLESPVAALPLVVDLGSGIVANVALQAYSVEAAVEVGANVQTGFDVTVESEFEVEIDG